jgi:hypothetical protein
MELPCGESQPYVRGPGHRVRKHDDRGPPANRFRESGGGFDPKGANGNSGEMRRIRQRGGESISSAMGNTGLQSGQLDWNQGCSCRFRFAPEPQSEDPKGS